MTAPRVSVLIPCYNLGRYLADAVASVHRQTFTGYEILIVDDGSDDPETVATLTNASWPGTTVFRTPNGGLARSRNFLVGHARGEFLCALDADDMLDPEYLARTVTVLDSSPDLAFVSTHLQMFGTESRQWPDTDRCDLEALLCDDTVITAALVRKSAVLAVGGYDEAMPEPGNEDWDLWIRLVRAGYRGVILPEVLFHYRRRPGSMSERCTRGQAHLDLIEYIVEKHQEDYRRFMRPVLLWKEDRIAALRRLNMSIEQEVHGFLEPAVERRSRELAALRARLDTAPPPPITTAATGREAADLQALQVEYARSLDEVRALRSSWSWTLTAPLRKLYEALWRRRNEGDA